MVWDIDRKLQRTSRGRSSPTAGRRMLAALRQKGVTIHVNSIYNNWRFEDVWLDR
jgi:peptide/nickel transport system substrate-binding protein